MTMDHYMPVRLVTGRGCVRKNAGLLAGLGKKALIVTGKHAAKACGALTDVCCALESQGIGSVLFDEITQNPRLTDCMKAAAIAVKEACDFIIGIGGGSAMDAAKCICVLAANPGMTQEELYSLHWPVHPLPAALVGTTAGTGSEVTKVSVISVPGGRKKSFHHEDVFPAVSFGDPAYTDRLPMDITCSTAIDALSHAVESYFSRNANEMSKCFAVRGIRMILPMLEKLGADGCLSDAGPAPADGCPVLSAQDRDTLYYASIYGGLAINQTGTCLPHAMGYLLTEQYGIPHGNACAVFLSDFLRINAEREPGLTSAFYGETGTDPRKLISVIHSLLRDVRITVTEEEIAASHERWIEKKKKKKGWGNITADECDAILRNLPHRN